MRTQPIDRRCPTCDAKPGKMCIGRDGYHAKRCDPLASLHGVLELRALVRWANAQYESEHENMTAEEILARFRKERDA